MNYAHAYHAGNAADVHKHLVLSALITAMQKKPKPFCYIDSHAGEGLYNLNSLRMRKSQDAKFGILAWYDKLIDYSSHRISAQCIQQYIKAVQEVRQSSQGTDFLYPGSPYLASLWVREIDTLILNEGYSPTYLQLKKHLKNLQHPAYCHNRDAYEFLGAILPPTQRRALILIDPTYELPEEEKIILNCIKTAYERFPTGVYAIWYPLKGLRIPIYSTLRWLQLKSIPHLTTEWRWSNLKSENIGLNGTGVLIINPPWQIEKELKAIHSFMEYLSHGLI